jgi:predicted CXXCH cytochrome family protein
MPRLLLAIFALGHLQAASFGASAAFPHLNPTHSTLECGNCHSIKASETDLHEMPGHAACTACHNFAEQAVKRAESFCGPCHSSIDAGKDQAALFAFPKRHDTRDFGDQFSHVAHKNAGAAARCERPGATTQSQCADCHATVGPAAAAAQREKQLEASHAFCFACHCDKPRNYAAANVNANPSRNDCAVCHVAKEAPLASFANVPGFRHADHLFDTRPRLASAGPVSHDPDILCVECHRTAAESRHLATIRQPAVAVCVSCHTGKPGLPDVLPAALLKPLETGQ